MVKDLTNLLLFFDESGGNMKNKNFVIRLIFYITGIVILTFGIALTIEANLGASPIDALLVGLHNSFGLTVGSWEYIIAIFLLVINSIAVGKRPQLLALSTAILVGIGIDFWLKIFAPTDIFVGLGINITALLAGTFLCSFGIATYLQADFLPSPFDETMLVISQRFNLSLFVAKTILMTFFLILAFLFKGPVAIGTIIILIISGPIIGWTFPKMKALKTKTMGVL